MTDLTTRSLDDLNILVFGAEQHIVTAALDELHTRAGREAVARSMTTEDLREMLPGFERLAMLIGQSLERAVENKAIVIDELARRAAAPREDVVTLTQDLTRYPLDN